MAEQSVVIKVKLRIQRQHLFLRSNDQRINFYQRTIQPDEGAIQPAGFFGSIIGAIIALLVLRAYRRRRRRRWLTRL